MPPHHAAQPGDRLRDASRSSHGRTRRQVRRNFAFRPTRRLRAQIRFQLELDVPVGYRVRAGCSAIACGPPTPRALHTRPPQPLQGPHGGFPPRAGLARSTYPSTPRTPTPPPATLRTPTPSPASTPTLRTSSTSGRTPRTPSPKTTLPSNPYQGRLLGWL
jgi:hypothetical protein